MRSIIIIIALLLIIPVTGNLALSEEISKDESTRLEKFLRKRLGTRLPADSTIKVIGYDKTEIKGFKKGTFSVSSSRGSGDVPFLISDDGKYVIFGDPIDLKEFKESPVKGLLSGNILIGKQKVPVLMSKDGNYLIAGEIVDSTIDPHREVKDKISLENTPVKGSEKASVTVVEYSDFQCPFCKKGKDMLPQILEEYDGKVKIYYKQMPLPNHNWARQASVASYCVFQQDKDKFWEFHDMVFDNQNDIKLINSNEKFNEYSKNIGLDTKKFKDCLNSKEVSNLVDKDMKEAQSIGVSSTPTFVVDGMIVPGANPDGLKSAIELKLSEGS
ncbi:MAG: thioredoxin domain-containing protein [Thermodesulfobacteriota bacterium]